MSDIFLRVTPIGEKKPVLVHPYPFNEQEQKEIVKKLMRYLKKNNIKPKNGRTELEVAIETVDLMRKLYPDEEVINVKFEPYNLVISTVKL